VVSSGHACLRWLASEPPNVEKAVLSANRMIRDANRASEVIQRVRKLVKNTPPQMSPLNVNEAIEEIVILCRNEIEQNRVSLKTQLPPDLPLVYADRVLRAVRASAGFAVCLLMIDALDWEGCG
jgi:nitrogen-specific signal transduction histidine kinase